MGELLEISFLSKKKLITFDLCQQKHYSEKINEDLNHKSQY